MRLSTKRTKKKIRKESCVEVAKIIGVFDISLKTCAFVVSIVLQVA